MAENVTSICPSKCIEIPNTLGKFSHRAVQVARRGQVRAAESLPHCLDWSQVCHPPAPRPPLPLSTARGRVVSGGQDHYQGPTQKEEGQGSRLGRRSLSTVGYK
ncbi:hypothetical protein CRENBAI_005737 [Crenichthys baileyi]|uniref:Uncharacterized protein n=1 Tax=Crenichthys baileyi TaxID=28760 RepID=A0AAV9QZ21_9TELE